jgi:RNA polymerase subunit RPABC4/transcription elongation factor Spt4
MSDQTKCFKCGAMMNRAQEVCPACREKQRVRKTWKLWLCLAVAFVAWFALR